MGSWPWVALVVARRQDAAASAHDDAREAVNDLLNHRGNGEPPATLRKRKGGVYGCEAIRRLAPNHQHRFKDEALP